MKLELKHLVGYLPYGLSCHGQGEILEGTEYEENAVPKLLTITGLDANWITVEGIGITVDENIMIEDCIPILRPLSDLTKEIDVNGEKLVPIEWLEDKYYTLDLHKQCLRLLEEDGENWINQCNYMLVQQLLEWYFDIYGLIEAGLAIDINTLEIK